MRIHSLVSAPYFHPPIHPSMALQCFAGPRPLFQFLNPTNTQSLGLLARKLRQSQTQVALAYKNTSRLLTKPHTDPFTRERYERQDWRSE
jgi:hypothetical protein